MKRTPEFAPLTPEEVEDEARRGDFVLRWAVVLLAFLFGCTEVAESATLIHLRTGEYLAQHGWWPPAREVFSYTAVDRPWVNFAWLFDLLLAGVYGLGGASGLSLLTGLVAAVTFGLLVNTQRANLPTWWGAICAVLALLACSPQFTAQPEIVTLLGTALLLWLLHRWHESGAAAPLWCLVPVVLVWSNLDPRAWLGLTLLLLQGLGDLIGRAVGRPSIVSSDQRRRFWIVCGVSVLVSMIHPFGWKVWTAPYRLYAFDYPALRLVFPQPNGAELASYPLTDPLVWMSHPIWLVAGLLLFLVALSTLLLNWSRLEAAHQLVFLGFNGLAVAAAHELAAASLVNCVLATLNAQAWYRHTFRQTYSVESGELLFSRGGRALTVFAFLGLALLGIGGRIDPAEGTRVGLGFTSSLQALIDGYRQALDDSFDSRPFNCQVQQGDVLIWIGQQPFIDSRIGLYAGEGETNLLAVHDRTRHALRQKRDPLSTGGRPDVWKAVFDKYQVTHVLPRLSGTSPPPDYTTFSDLLASPDWQLTKLGAVTAAFYRTDRPDPELRQYLQTHQVELIDLAFRSPDAPPLGERAAPRPPTLYQKYLSAPNRTVPNAVQEARHYLWLEQSGHLPPLPRYHAACLYLVIRGANAGLVDQPNCALAYWLLGEAYQTLDRLETQISAAGNAAPQIQLRYLQAVQAYHQSLVLEPDNSTAQSLLLALYLDHHRPDLALRAVTNYLTAVADRESISEAEFEQHRQFLDQRLRLQTVVNQFHEQVRKELERGENRFNVALQASLNGFVLEALRVLEEDPAYLGATPMARPMYAALLMEAGRAEQAAPVVETLSSSAALTQWATTAAALHVIQGNYLQAIGLWRSALRESDLRNLEALLSTLPLAAPPPRFGIDGAWPITHYLVAQRMQAANEYESPLLLFNSAVAALEAGQLRQSQQLFEELLDRAPEAEFRPLARFYLYLLAEKLIDPEPPSDWIPISRDMFAEE